MLQPPAPSAHISCGVLRPSSPTLPFPPVALFRPAPLTGTLPANQQTTPASEAGRLSVDLSFSFCSSRSNPPVSSPQLRQTFSGDLPSLSPSIPGRWCSRSWLNVLLFSFLRTFQNPAYSHSSESTPNTQKHILPVTPVTTTIRSKENTQPGNTQPPQSPDRKKKSWNKTPTQPG